MYRRTLFFATVILTLLLGAATALAGPIPWPTATDPLGSLYQANTWYVSPAGDDVNDCLSHNAPCATINGAFSKATAGDLVVIATGTYRERLVLDKDITLQGTRASGTVIDGDFSGRVIEVPLGVSAQISNLTIANGFTAQPGAGLYISGTLHLDHSIVLNNASAYGANGGGIYNSGTLTLTYSLLQENTASTWGGGLYNTGAATLLNSAVISNAASSGGGIYNTGSMFLRNDTVSGNAVSNAAALYNEGFISVTNSTIAYNHVSAGPGAGGVLASEMAEARFKNSVISDNDNANCEDFGYYSDGYNIDSGTSCQFFHPSDQNNTDPLLQALADNGGPTPTHAVTGGPAVDMGTNNGCPPTDQRGAPRPVDGGSGSAVCDVGAYEHASIAPPQLQADLTIGLELDGGPTLPINNSIAPRLRLFVSNPGDAAITATYEIGMYISPDAEITTADTLLNNGLADGVALAAGEMQVQVPLPEWISIPSSTPPGPAYLGVIADHYGFVPEGDRSNNIAVIPVYLLPSGPHTWVVKIRLDDIDLFESLRFALSYARSSDTITFSSIVFPPTQTTAITLTEPLPSIDQGNLTIDGTGAGEVIDGSNLVAGQYGLVLDSNRNELLGLDIRNAPTGLLILGYDNLVGQESSSDCDTGMKVNRPPASPYNVFRGNSQYGIEIRNDDNIVVGNAMMDNGLGGVLIEDGNGNYIGGTQLYEGNVIGGNGAAGLLLSGTSQQNWIYGNRIGTDESGSSPYPNGNGIILERDTSNISIGGSEWCQGNLITANTEWGIVVRSGGNTVAGNIIGAFLDMPEPIPTTQNGLRIEGGTYNTIGGQSNLGDCYLVCNQISNNGGVGILLTDAAERTSIQGNYIGVNLEGDDALTNGLDGIHVEAGSFHVIGKNEDGSATGNLISGNGGAGVHLSAGVDNVLIQGNIIGLNVAMTQTIGNEVGVWLEESHYSVLEENVIAGNRSHGVHMQGIETHDNDLRASNRIGTNLQQAGNLGNKNAGVLVSGGAFDNEIHSLVLGNGGAGIRVHESPDNTIQDAVILKNTGSGIVVSGTNSINVYIIENEIGQNGEHGLELLQDCSDVFVRNNEVYENSNYGLLLSGNTHDNFISRITIHDNSSAGITLYDGAYDNTIGENDIYDNDGSGVQVIGATTIGNHITQNRIYGNGGLRIDNSSGGNTELEPPKIVTAKRTGGANWQIEGETCPSCRVEFFVNTPGGVSEYITDQVADSSGLFSFAQVVTYGRYFDLTAIDLYTANTSEYLSDQFRNVSLEITEVDLVQTLDGPIRNISDKPSYVLVRARSDSDVMPILARAMLRVEREGKSPQTTSPFPQPDCPLEITLTPNPDQTKLEDSFCFLLSPGQIHSGTITLTASLYNYFSEYPGLAADTMTKVEEFTDSAPLVLRIFLISHPENLRGRKRLPDAYNSDDQLTIGDVDADGRAEIIVGRDADYPLDVYHYNPISDKLVLTDTIPGDDQSGFHQGDAIATGNVDGVDGVEVVIANVEANNLDLWSFNLAAANWQRVVINHTAVLDVQDRLAVGDLDGDGYADVVIGGTDGSIEVYRHKGTGWADPFFAPIALATTYHIVDLVVGDVDLDGVNEVLLGDTGTDAVHIYTWANNALVPYVGLDNQLAVDLDNDSRLALVDVDLHSVNGADFAEIIVAQDGFEQDGIIYDAQGLSVFAWTGQDWERKVLVDDWSGEGVYSADGSLAVGNIMEIGGRPEIVSCSPDSRDIYVYDKKVAGEWRTIEAADFFGSEIVSILKRMFPLGQVEYIVASEEIDVLFGSLGSAKWWAFLENARQQENLPYASYAVVMNADGKGNAGVAAGRPTVISISESGQHVQWVGLGVAAHEIGHTRGRPHAALPICGPSGLASPYPEGLIASLPDPQRSGVLVLDVSQATTPTLAGSNYESGFWHDVAVENDYLYMANYYATEGSGGQSAGGLASFSLSDPQVPIFWGNLSLAFGGNNRMAGGVRRVEISGNYAYIADVFGGLIVVDISDPAYMAEESRFELPLKPFENPPTAAVAYLYDLHVEGSTVYAVDFPYWTHNGKDWYGGHLRLLDASDPGDLQLMGIITPTAHPLSVFASGNYAYVTTQDGLEVYDVSDATAPLLQGTLDIDHQDSLDVFVEGDYAYVATTAGLKIVNVQDKANPVLVRSVSVGHSYEVQVLNGYAYLASRLKGLQIVDVSLPDSAFWVGEYNPPGTPFMSTGLDVVGNHVYLSTWSAAFHGFDAGDLFHEAPPQILSGYNNRDLMSYCDAANRWLSWQNYNAIYLELNASYPGAQAVAQADTLQVVGQVNPVQDSGQLDLLYRDPNGMPLSPLPLTSTVHLQLLDQGNQVLADYALNTIESYDPESPDDAYALALGDVVAYEAGTVLIRLLLEDAVVATQTVSPNPPQITLLAPNGGETLGDEVEVRWSGEDADGDPLVYTILVSPDGGDSWRVVAGLLRGNSYSLDTSYLRGSTDTRFRIIAHDGVNTASDESDGPITMPTRPPEVEIASPEHWGHYEPLQSILLLAQARDPDGRPIPEEGYVWSSDVDGALGTGEGLYVSDLSAGWHTITLTVTDADGETAEDSVQIMVGVLYRHYLPLLFKGNCSGQ